MFQNLAMKNKIEVDKSEIIEWIETLHKNALFIRKYSRADESPNFPIKRGDLHKPAVMILGVRKKLKKLINYYDQSDLDRNGALYHHVKNLEKKDEAIINKKSWHAKFRKDNSYKFYYDQCPQSDQTPFRNLKNLPKS